MMNSGSCRFFNHDKNVRTIKNKEGSPVGEQIRVRAFRFWGKCVSGVGKDEMPAGVVPAFLRAQGELRAEFAATRKGTYLARHYEAGGFRLRVPQNDQPGSAEGVLINTGGGLVGGDTGRIAVKLAPSTRVTLTSQSAEKIYGSQGPQTQLDIELELDEAAHLDWIPQETILFRDAHFARKLNVNMAASASLTMLDSVVLGRKASGEAAVSGILRDQWRIKRGGHLVFAENISLGPQLDRQLARKTVAGGAMCMAMFLHVAPQAEARLE